MAQPIDDSRWRDPAILTNGRRVSYGADLDADFVPMRDSKPRAQFRLRDLADLDESGGFESGGSESIDAVAAAFCSLARSGAVSESGTGELLSVEQILDLPVGRAGDQVNVPAGVWIRPAELVDALRELCSGLAVPGLLARLLIQDEEPSVTELAEALAAVSSDAVVSSSRPRPSAPSSPSVRRHREGIPRRPAPTSANSGGLGDGDDDDDDPTRFDILTGWFKGKTAATVALAVLSVAFAGSLLLNSSREASADAAVDPPTVVAVESTPEPAETTAPRSREALPLSAPVAAPNWKNVIAELDSLRTSAFVKGTAVSLALVNAPDSEAARQDQAVMAELVRLDAHVEKLQTTVSSVVVVSESASRAEVDVTDSRSGYQLVANRSGDVIGHQAPRGTQTWRVELAKVAERWLMVSSREVDG